MVKDEIIKAIQKATSEKDVHLEVPEKGDFGDYSSNIAMAMFSRVGDKREFNNARELAIDLIGKLQKDKDLAKVVDKIEVAGSGFINFWLNNDVLTNNVIQIDSAKDEFGKTKRESEKIIFEFGQPNTHKLPHIGHLFSYIYGNASSRILEAVGYKVRRVNYQGDIGLHVAKCLWVYRKKNPIIPDSPEAKVKLLQECYQEGSLAYEKDKEIKKEIDSLNKAIYSQNPKICDLWLKTRSWSVRYYKDFEERVGVTYDRSYFESEVYKDALDIVKANSPKIFQESQGAVIFSGSEYGLHDRVFINSAGDPTYEAKDLALARLKLKEWPADKLIVTTASEQNEYFRVLIKALETIDPSFKGKFKHIGFGMIDLKEGKMSSRTGEFIGAIELVEAVVREIKNILKNRKDISEDKREMIAEMVGIGAVKYSFLKNNPLQNTKFDIKESISTDGNSGPYLQYTYARCKSVLTKAGKQTADYRLPTTEGSLVSRQWTVDMNEEETDILRSFVHFPETVEKAALEYAPNVICEYIYDLAQKYNTFYNKYSILGAESDLKLKLRLKLTSATAQILKNGLTLLGISVPEKM